MGVGEFLSSKAENEWILSEKRREEWELENYREGEIQEMIDIYISKGMTPEDAKVCIETMAKYDDFFVDIMMMQELELQVPEDNHVQESMKEGEDLFSVIFNQLVPFLAHLQFSECISLIFHAVCLIQPLSICPSPLKGSSCSVPLHRSVPCLCLGMC